MPLNEHEQKILDEIERQMYEEDPKLANKVARAVRTGNDRWRMRLAAVIFVVGAVVMFASFTASWIIAGIGFVIMVSSAGWMAHAVGSKREAKGMTVSLESLMDRFGRRDQGRD
jgi:uncharacterized membrane protein YgcG